MRPLLRCVPQVQRLAIFDAVASNHGFTSAATELGISQPAVSRHISLLERHLSTSLLRRSGATTELTEDGRRLADAVNAGFGVIERALDDIAAHRDTLVLAVQPAMATSWIVPALETLEQAIGTPIRLRIFDRASALDANDWDLAIVPGRGDWSRWESTELFGEAVRPLAAPSFAHEHNLDGSTPPERLADFDLIHIDASERPSMTWAQWFEAAGVSFTPSIPNVVYDAYSTAIQEALVGHGIALGWRHLAGDLVRRRLLVPVGPLVEHRGIGHHLCWRRGSSDTRFQTVEVELRRRLEATPPALA